MFSAEKNGLSCLCSKGVEFGRHFGFQPWNRSSVVLSELPNVVTWNSLTKFSLKLKLELIALRGKFLAFSVADQAQNTKGQQRPLITSFIWFFFFFFFFPCQNLRFGKEEQERGFDLCSCSLWKLGLAQKT